MGEDGKNSDKNTAPPDTAGAPATPSDIEERNQLIKIIHKLQAENKILYGRLESDSPEMLQELKTKNEELKKQVSAAEMGVAQELSARKKTLDASGISDKLQVLKAAVVSYCKDRNIDPTLWKNLESL